MEKCSDTREQEIKEKALGKLRNGDMNFNEVLRRYNIPKPIQRSHRLELNKHNKFVKPKDLTKAMDKEIAEHVLTSHGQTTQNIFL
ncbi:hypothetical protein AVEN_213320-1 [Araneus ventricosus]|uniref:HTH psq-type domain-containing protein n=1 Tax=Araneus ventricosus TaxID=182803 RepID=A0A4Y2LLF9_ARAVE|nr:hypothetical protein AVEN_213320-1 [Araneus ventricosus]